MQTPSPHAQSQTHHKSKPFPWMIVVIISSALIVILAFVVATLFILRSQGAAQGINTLTILSIVFGFGISVLSLVVSFLQLHHPKDPSAPEKLIAAPFVQTPPPSSASQYAQSPVLLIDTPQEPLEKQTALALASQVKHRFDWGEAPQMDQLYGRDKELTTLKQWLVDARCRLVAILGMGGIGKTGLAATLVDQLQEHYDSIFWRSLHNAPPLESILQECISFVSAHADTILPADVDHQISLLLEYLRRARCLLVFDNVESILQGGSQAGQYREGYEKYGRLIQRIGEGKHQSCLLITSREKPPEVALLEGETVATRSLHLAGLEATDGRGILTDKGLQGTEDEWGVLITNYGGNPLILTLAAQVIREVFGSTISTFLHDGELFFHDVHNILEQQMKRLSAREEEIIYWLAIEREPVTLSTLQENIAHPLSKGELQEAVRSLQRRYLIETSEIGVTLHPVIMEYLTDRFVNRVCEEIKTEKLELFERYALLKARAKGYIRESQYRLILQPLLHRLLALFTKEVLEQRFQRLLATIRTQHDHHAKYVAGNVLNMLVHMGGPLRGYDFSHLEIRQAYLLEVTLPEVNFAYADLGTSVFTDTFGGIYCVAFNPHEDVLAAGTASGEIRFWNGSGLPLVTSRGHTDWVRSVAFSPDGKSLASSSHDQTVRLWEVSSGKLLATLQGHTNTVYSVAFNPDGKTLASGSNDQTVRIWEVSSGKLLAIFQGHTNTVYSVTFSPDGKILASGSRDQTVRLWEVNSGQCFTILRGHTDVVRSIAFSPDSKTLVSGSEDQTVRLWKVGSEQCLITLQGHTNVIRSVAFSPDGKTLVSGGGDQTVRLWKANSGQCLITLRGHTNTVYSVAFNPDGKTLASGSNDQTVRVWEVSNGRCLSTLQSYSYQVRSVAFSPDGKTLISGSYDQRVRVWEVNSGKLLITLGGHTDIVRSVAFSPDGKTLASGSSDSTVRVWEVNNEQCLTTLGSHTGVVRSVAFSPNGKTLASGSSDRTVRVWEVNSGQCINILQGHTGVIYSVAFSPDGKTLASGSGDQTVCLWEVSSGKLLTALQGHTNVVMSVAFSPDGKILASGLYDQTVCLWEVSSGKLLTTLQGHTGVIYSVAFSPNGKTLASGSGDSTVRVWEVSSGQCLTTLQGHNHWVNSVVFNSDGKILASSGFDGTIKLWNWQACTCLQTLRSDRPYERMNITQVKGLTETQKAALTLLGAIEDEQEEKM